MKEIDTFKKGDLLFLRADSGEFKKGAEFVFRGTDNATVWIEPRNFERKTKFADEGFIYITRSNLAFFASRTEARAEKLKELGL